MQRYGQGIEGGEVMQFIYGIIFGVIALIAGYLFGIDAERTSFQSAQSKEYALLSNRIDDLYQCTCKDSFNVKEQE